jgi:hypothetical protein
MLEKRLKSLVVINGNGSPVFDLVNIGLKNTDPVVLDFGRSKFLRDIPKKFFNFSDYSVLKSGIYVNAFRFPVYAALREDESIEVGPLPSVFKAYATQNGLDLDELPLFYLGSFNNNLEQLFLVTNELGINKDFSNHVSKVYDLKDF